MNMLFLSVKNITSGLNIHRCLQTKVPKRFEIKKLALLSTEIEKGGSLNRLCVAVFFNVY